jgi:fructosamine-3-kinase
MATYGPGMCLSGAEGLRGSSIPPSIGAIRRSSLTFTTLFGTFGQAFFAAYAGLLPLEPGFHELRCDIYNLYPRLVHVRLFGRAYLAGIDQTLARLGL